MPVICGHKGCKGQTPVAGRECYAGVSHLHFFQNNGPDKELTDLGFRAFVG